MIDLMAREKAGELSDTILRKQKTDDLLRLGTALWAEANKRHREATERADRIILIAHDLAEERGEHMGVDGI